MDLLSRSYQQEKKLYQEPDIVISDDRIFIIIFQKKNVKFIRNEIIIGIVDDSELPWPHTHTHTTVMRHSMLEIRNC